MFNHLTRAYSSKQRDDSSRYDESSSQVQKDDESMIEEEADTDYEAIERERQRAKMELNLKEYASRAMIIPSCSSWFDLDKIHEIEMQTLPEFFCAKFPHKNPSTYFNFRNSIIKMYRERPSAYLSATECRKKLPGDVCSIIRLHAFLE